VRLCAAFLAGLIASTASSSANAAPKGGSPVALVTAESENELLAVSLPDGKVIRRVRLPVDPENVDVQPSGPAIVVSTKGGAVSILQARSLRPIRVLRGFRDPHIAAIAPDGEWAYVTDDGTGLLSVIELARAAIVNRVFVGMGAHHLSFSPDERHTWVALGERARTIVVLDTSRPSRPRVVSRFDPGFPAHDVAFSPDGRHVWVTSDAGGRAGVFDSTSRRLLFTVPVGTPPQHVAFGARGFAYLTSGYGSRIVMADARGRVVRSSRVPYGSFNVTTAGGLVVTSSLLRGTLTELNSRLRLLRTVKVAPTARDAGVSVW
jgi:DNA-binding beta-propeller fold protein YncE